MYRNLLKKTFKIDSTFLLSLNFHIKSPYTHSHTHSYTYTIHSARHQMVIYTTQIMHPKCSELRCTALNCIAKHNIAPYCTVLVWTALDTKLQNNKTQKNNNNNKTPKLQNTRTPKHKLKFGFPFDMEFPKYTINDTNISTPIYTNTRQTTRYTFNSSHCKDLAPRMSHQSKQTKEKKNIRIPPAHAALTSTDI